MLKQFDGSGFRRTQAATAEGLTCGIALPIFAGDLLTAVLVLFCGDLTRRTPARSRSGAMTRPIRCRRAA